MLLAVSRDRTSLQDRPSNRRCTTKCAPLAIHLDPVVRLGPFRQFSRSRGHDLDFRSDLCKVYRSSAHTCTTREHITVPAALGVTVRNLAHEFRPRNIEYCAGHCLVLSCRAILRRRNAPECCGRILFTLSHVFHLSAKRLLVSRSEE